MQVYIGLGSISVKPFMIFIKMEYILNSRKKVNVNMFFTPTKDTDEVTEDKVIKLHFMK